MIKRRREFVEKLNGILVGIHRNLTGGKEEIVIEYEPNVMEDRFAEEISRQEDRELRQKMSFVGPHRDDINFMVNGIDIRKFGSQGQQRTAELSLKLEEIELEK